MMKKLKIIFKNGAIKEYYNLIELNKSEFDETFLVIKYKPFDGFKFKEFCRISEIASWEIEEKIEDKNE